jgi:tetratricopeptide (TPR) repeat protein
MGGGVAILDYDNDGWQDVFFVNGARLQNPQPDWPLPDKSAPEFWNRLFRNRGDGTFTDVTQEAGLQGHGYGMGIATGDFDNDGDTDLVLTNYGDCVLYRNNSEGTFTDITARAGIRTEGWNMSAGFFDYNNDGYLDIFVTRYLVWNFAIGALVCGPAIPGGRAYCHPNEFKAISNYLFRNNRDGTFADVSAASGIRAHEGYGLGVSFADFNQDGFMDVYVANDAFPQFLFKNNRDGTFTEVATLAGVGFTEDGNTFSGMGTVFADLDNDGFPDILTTALPYEYFAHFHNNGDGTFNYASVTSNLAEISRSSGGWGINVFDADNDGRNEVFVATSHVMDNIEVTQPHLNYMEKPMLLRFAGNRFVNVSAEAGEPFQQAWAARGAAFGDLNNDGYIDIVVSDYQSPAHFLRNAGGGNHWIGLELEGTRSNRDGIGARVELTTAEGRKQFRTVNTAGSYASANDPRVFFGLGEEKSIERIRIRWPSGVEQALCNPPADRILRVTETSSVGPESSGASTPHSRPSPQSRPAFQSRHGPMRNAAFRPDSDATRIYEAGLALAEKGKLVDAVEKFRAATDLRPDFYDAYFAMGVVLREQGRSQAPAAVDAFLKVLELNSNHIGAHVNLSSMLADGGDSEAAAAQLRKAVEIDPLNPQIRVQLGRQLYLSQKYRDALESFDAALRLNPGLGEAHLGRGLALVNLKRVVDAQAEFRSALRLNPKDAEAQLQLARSALESGELSSAAAHIKEAIRLRPQLAEAHEELAKVYRRQNMDREAEAELREALRLKPDLSEAAYALATLLRTQGKLAEARPLFDRIRDLQKKRDAPGRATALNADGIKLTDQGSIDAALAAFRQAREVDPTFFMAAYNEGVVLARLGQKAEAVEALRASIRLRPDFVMAHYALGIVLKTMGDPEGDREIAKAHTLSKFVAQPLGRNAASFVSPQEEKK